MHLTSPGLLPDPAILGLLGVGAAVLEAAHRTPAVLVVREPGRPPALPQPGPRVRVRFHVLACVGAIGMAPVLVFRTACGAI